MAYETPTEVMLGLYNKLLKDKDRYINKLAEIELTLKLIEYDDEPNTEMREELIKKKRENREKLYKTEKQLKLLQKRRNGGASLDPFLSDEVLQKTEDKMNELYPDNEIKIRRFKGTQDSE